MEESRINESNIISEKREPVGDGLLPAFSTSYGIHFDTDCMNVFAALNDGSIDCIFADPPFNLGKNYGNGAAKDRLSREEYLSWSYRWIDEAVRVIKPGGAIFIYILPQWGFHFCVHLEEKGMSFRHWIALSMKGTFPRGKKLYPAHYALLYFTKQTPKTFNHVRIPIPKCRHCGKDSKDYGGYRKCLNPLGLNLADFWEDTSPARHRKFKARRYINELKPMIPQRCFLIATNPMDLIFDPFAGGGSSLEAAEEAGRLWLGSEIATSQAIIDRFGEKSLDGFGIPPASLFSVFREGNKTAIANYTEKLMTASNRDGNRKGGLHGCEKSEDSRHKSAD
jgi:site-specific DNA-methyltransferase (adenine-specific)